MYLKVNLTTQVEISHSRVNLVNLQYSPLWTGWRPLTRHRTRREEATDIRTRSLFSFLPHGSALLRSSERVHYCLGIKVTGNALFVLPLTWLSPKLNAAPGDQTFSAVPLWLSMTSERRTIPVAAKTP
jgi:hypothetical protein